VIDPTVVRGVLETGGGQIEDLWALLCRAATEGSDSVWASWPTCAEGDRLLLWWGLLVETCDGRGAVVGPKRETVAEAETGAVEGQRRLLLYSV
jgi:hypothetical protein